MSRVSGRHRVPGEAAVSATDLVTLAWRSGMLVRGLTALPLKGGCPAHDTPSRTP
ncbi:hypothetical protein ACYF6T_03625 [Streptomyces sp. 7R007]